MYTSHNSTASITINERLNGKQCYAITSTSEMA